MTLETTTISGRPNAAALTGTERVPMDQGSQTVDASTAQIAALATKQTVGLGNVDNTSDLSKPISTATAAALAGKLTAYVHTQSTPASVWTINHNLGYRPSVELLDSGSQEIDGSVSHPSINQTVVAFSPPTAGLARLI